ncbi:glycosyltransferase family 2 protein [Bowmanella yangjiangensis]|uniref:Glycosyltransferase family 2 protein n=1 Tax=Bowmanella yangjiangensis TaxID=2811230 RepID=A0ABS3CTK3_9ALTE|nr:glycosyltransferase family 2 protein [Bowmanella yangjiangensis]MBN7820452.1 glycosyltransferase family 2 protein [Bowmanella yangjiangensis]
MSETSVSGAPLKVKIVAVAKDEAAYLTDWVHHHLFFGFDDIEIHINRTTDNSSQVLADINKEYPNVTWHEADWIDMCPASAKKQIQFIVYARALDIARRENSATHILFLDIDEFWCPMDFETSIKGCLNTLGADKAIFFEWLNDLGNEEPFTTLTKVLSGNLSPLGKTLLPVSVAIHELKHHVPQLAVGEGPLLADGRTFVGRDNLEQAVLPELNSLKPFFIFHRAHRSEYEYVSLLYRGRPGNNFAYKNNRNGLPRRGGVTKEVIFPSPQFVEYQKSLQQFKKRVKHTEHDDDARQFVHERYATAVENITANLPEHYKDMVRIFTGVRVDEVRTQFQAFRKIYAQQHSRNVEILKQLARHAVPHDVDEAIGYLEQALVIRPKGPQIKALLAEFKERKARRQG